MITLARARHSGDMATLWECVRVWSNNFSNASPFVFKTKYVTALLKPCLKIVPVVLNFNTIFNLEKLRVKGRTEQCHAVDLLIYDFFWYLHFDPLRVNSL